MTGSVSDSVPGSLPTHLISSQRIRSNLTSPRYRLILRFPRSAHPARLLSYLKLSEAVVTPAIFLFLRVPDAPVGLVLVVTGVLIGVLQSPQDMANHMLIGWAIDEDAAHNNFQRREGMFYACNGVLQHLSQAVWRK